MRFAVVELSLGMVIKTGRNWERMRDEVESSSPSRWDNPILIVIPDNYRSPREEGEIPEEYIRENVVAVPLSEWGYGTLYTGLVNWNRRRFGLPGTYTPPSIKHYGLIPGIAIREPSEEERELEIRRVLEDEEVLDWPPEKLLEYEEQRKLIEELYKKAEEGLDRDDPLFCSKRDARFQELYGEVE